MQNNALIWFFTDILQVKILSIMNCSKSQLRWANLHTERTPESITMLIDRVERVESNAIKIRVSSLYDKITEIQQSRVLRVLETHNGISGIIADTTREGNNEFDALWSSSLTASVSKGKPDIEVVDTSMRLQIVRDTMEVTKKPMIYDADTGGQPEILRFTVVPSKISVWCLFYRRQMWSGRIVSLDYANKASRTLHSFVIKSKQLWITH